MPEKLIAVDLKDQHFTNYPELIPALSTMLSQHQTELSLKPRSFGDKPVEFKVEIKYDQENNPSSLTVKLLDTRTNRVIPRLQLEMTIEQADVDQINLTGFYTNLSKYNHPDEQYQEAVVLFSPVDDAFAQSLATYLHKPVGRLVYAANEQVLNTFNDRGYAINKDNPEYLSANKVFQPASSVTT